MTPLAQARECVERGWVPVPVASREKRPAVDEWQKRTLDSPLEPCFNGSAKNIGLLLGKPSGGPVDVDLDCDEAVLAAPMMLPSTGSKFGRESCGTTHHLYDSSGVKTRQWKYAGKTLLELRGTGCQTVAYGIHPSGETIEFSDDGEPAKVEAETLLTVCGEVAAAALLARHWPVTARHDAALALAGGLRRASWSEGRTVKFVSAICRAAGDEEGGDRLAAVRTTYAREGGAATTGFKTLRETIGGSVVDKARGWLGVVDNHFEATGEAWEERLQRTTTGVLRNTLDNLRIILTEHPDWRGVLGIDEFRGNEVCKLLAPPFERSGTGSWTDADGVQLLHWMESKYGLSLRDQRAMDALVLAAQRRTHHAVREYLEALVWDGLERTPHWLTTYLGVPSTAYARGVGMRTLVGLVARVMEPGCKLDTVLVLEGKQGIGKSRALAALGGDWFSDTPVDLQSKDRFEVIRGQWLIELAELDAIHRAQPERIKSYLSSRQDRYRPSYGRTACDVPRQCVFVGTTNSDSYLTDATGNRRFWPVQCGAIDLDALVWDRDQLFAEALHHFRQGARWWLDNDGLVRRAAVEQSRRVRVHPWTAPVERYLKDSDFVTTADVLLHAIGMSASQWKTQHAHDMADVLRSLGWTATRSRQRRGWTKKRG